MTRDDDPLSLIGDIYEAALDFSLWRRVAERMMAVTDSQGATFCVLDSSGEPKFTALTTLNFDPVMIAQYVNGMLLHDPTVRAIAAHPDLRVFHDSALISETEKDRHLYYDWHRQFSDTHHRIAGMASPDATIQAGITVHRTRRKGDFDVRTEGLFAMLFGHVERALLIAFRLGTLGDMHATSLSLLDRNPIAIVFLDDKGRVVVANRAARDMAALGDGLTIAEGAVRLMRNTDHQTLQRLIGDALAATRDAGRSPGGVMSALRPSGKRPYSIVVSPLVRGTSAMATRRAAVCVSIADPEAQPIVPAHKLGRLYGLTPAEARLTIQLVNGEELRAAAEMLGVTYATARAQLSAIFRKTATHRQAELVKLLFSSLPMLTD